MYTIEANGRELDFEYTIEKAIKNAEKQTGYKNVQIKDGSRLVWSSEKEKAKVHK